MRGLYQSGLRNFADHDMAARLGGYLRDSRAHQATAHNSYFFNAHLLSLSMNLG